MALSLETLRSIQDERNPNFESPYHFSLFHLFDRYHGNLSVVTGGRAPSFRDLSVGETAAPDLSGECGGGKTPPQINRRKDQLGSLGTIERFP